MLAVSRLARRSLSISSGGESAIDRDVADIAIAFVDIVEATQGEAANERVH